MASEKVGSAFVEVSPKMAGNFKGVIEKAMPDGTDGGSRFGGGFSDGMKGAVSAGAVAVGNILADVARTAAAGVKDIMGQALDGFGDFEQLQGGIQLALGDDVWATVEQRGADAFRNLQMSQNDYLDQVNFMATGLREALGGDQQAAADLADRVITTQADVVSAMGASAESVQNAFQGVMKGNFTMLDNLQLGIKPTKEGMQEVIDKMNEWNAAQSDREATDYAIDNLADCQSALADYVEYLGLSGYAAMEGSETVQGSLATMGAAWTNFVSSLMKGDADVGKLAGDLVDAVGNVANKVMPLVTSAVGAAAEALPALVSGLLPMLSEQVGNLVQSLVPALVSLVPVVLDAGIQLLSGLLDALNAVSPMLCSMLPALVAQLGQALVSAAPTLLSSAVSLFTNVAVAIAQAAPQIVGTLLSLVPQLVGAIAGAAPQMLAGAVLFFMSIGKALNDAAEQIAPALAYFVTHLPEIVVGAIGDMANAAGEFFGTFLDALSGGIPAVMDGASEMASGAAEAAASGADGSTAASALTSTMAASMDFSAVEANATAGMQAAAQAAATAADGAQASEALAESAIAAYDVNAMDAPSAEMVGNAVEAAKSVDAAEVGRRFSEQAASGVDVDAMSGKAAQMAAKLGSLNQTATVAVKADTSGASALQAASATVAGAYAAMASAVSASMAKARASAVSTAAAISKSVSIPDKTVKVNVAAGNVKLPHFSMSGSFDPKTKAVPHVNVSWYAKGAIFEANSPGLIGIGDAPEPEVAAPLSALRDMLGVAQRPQGNVTVQLNYTHDEGAAQLARDLGRALGRRSLMEA